MKILDYVEPDKFSRLFKNDIPINALQMILILCTLYVLYRVRKRLLIDEKKILHLRDYIRNEIQMHDKSEGSIDMAIKVIKETVSQFYSAWIFLWLFFFIYYSANTCTGIMHNIPGITVEEFELTKVTNVVNNFLNYSSSTAMFCIFIVLNSITVSQKERNIRRNGLTSSYAFIFLFGCISLLPTIISLAQFETSYYRTQFFVSLVLSVYSSLVFVLMLGKLNSVYLHIPRFIYYGLYFYAIAQMFQFLLIDYKMAEWFNLPYTIPAMTHRLGLIFQYVTFFGKIFLSLTLLWIMYESKFTCYIVHYSLELTESEYVKQSFRAYIK